MYFLDAAYVTDPTKRIFTTIFYSTFVGGAFAYRSKTQSINDLSSTESYLIASAMTVKTDRFFSSVL